MELLNDGKDLYFGQSDQDNDQVVKKRLYLKYELATQCVANWKVQGKSMTEQQWKEVSKYFLDNGNRRLSKEEKEIIKAAIDQTDNLYELLQAAFASLAIDLHR